MNMIFFFKLMADPCSDCITEHDMSHLLTKKTEIISHPLPYKNSTSYVTSNEQRNRKMDSLNKG